MMLSEKYRPMFLDEVVGQVKIVKICKEYIKKGDIPHLLFAGRPGTGKTTIAQCIPREMFGDKWRDHYIETNASDDRGIDFVRKEIKRWVFTKTDGIFIIHLDEADKMTKDAQDALRRTMEKGGKRNKRFILTCNDPRKIIDAILSRCTIFEFKPLEPSQIRSQIVKVLKAEGVNFKELTAEEASKVKKGLEYLVASTNGDLRTAYNRIGALMTSDKKLLVEEFQSLEEYEFIKNAFNTAFKGDFPKAQRDLEEGFAKYQLDHVKVLQDFKKCIQGVRDLKIRARLSYELGLLDYRCKISTPIIQLNSFLSYIWIVQHIPDTCPGLSSNI